MKSAIDFSDGIIISSESITEDLTNYIETSGKPFIPFTSKEKMSDVYTDFYKKIAL